MKGVSVSCYVSCYKPPEMSQTPTLLALLRETSHVLLCFNSPLRVAWFKFPVATAKDKLGVREDPMSIFGDGFRSDNAPVTPLAPKIWCYITGGLEASGDNLAHHLLQESLSVCFSKFFCSSEVSPRVEFINLLKVHCFSYDHSALHKLNFVIYYHRTVINLHIIHQRNCVWKTWISILKCPARAWTSIPLEPATRSTPAYLTLNILLGIQQCQRFIKLDRSMGHD